MSTDLGVKVPTRSADVSVTLMGLMFAFALSSFGVTFAWFLVDGGLFWIQLPLVLLTFLTVAVTGLLYFINPTKWLAFFLIGLVYFSFEVTLRGGGGGGDLQSVLKGVFTLALAVVGLFTAFRSSFRTPLLTLFFSYSVIAMLSAWYSPLMVVGLVAGIALVGVSVIAAKMATGTLSDVAGYWRAIYWASVATAVLSLMVLVIAPSQARDLLDPVNYRLRGVTGSANTLGPIMGVAVIVGLFMIKQARTRWVWRFHAAMLVLFTAELLLTNSRSSILGAVAGVTLSVIVAGGVGVMGLLSGSFVLAILATVLLYPGLQEMLLAVLAAAFSRTGQVTELTTFTGRQQIWESSWQLINDAPWFGYGLSSVSVKISQGFSDQWGNSVTTAHNSLLESLISVGLVGTLPLVLVVVMSIWYLVRHLLTSSAKIAKSTDPDAELIRGLSRCALGCIVMMLVQGFGEKSFAGHPGSPFLALGGVVATAAFLALHPIRKKQYV